MLTVNYQTLLDFMKTQPVIDTHEHVQSMDEVRKQGLNIFKVFKNSYARLDFVSAGMPEEVWDLEDEDKIWEIFSKYQNYVSQTEYINNIFSSLRDLYELKDKKITKYNYSVLTKKINDAYKDNQWYHKVYKERGNVEIGLLDTFWSIEDFTFDKDLFRPVYRVDAFIKGKGFVSPYDKKPSIHSTLERIATAWKMDIDTLDDTLAVLGEGFKRFKNASAAAMKIAVAYHRSIYFESVSREEAEKSFRSNGDKKACQDYIAHMAIKHATEVGLPVQIHTGLLARNINEINNTDPTLLNNLFLQYPDTKFVLFHFSYPFVDKALSLTKMFRNVYIDFCWVPIISRRMAISSLDKALDLIPYNKIMWGGDAYRIEEAYGALVAAREVVAEVLANRIDRDRLDIDGAKKIARSIFYDNAIEL